MRLKPWSAFCASADCENLYGTNRLIIDVKNSALPPACPEKLIYNLASTPARASGRLGGRPPRGLTADDPGVALSKRLHQNRELSTEQIQKGCVFPEVRSIAIWP